MKYKRYQININNIIPQQHYLSRDKYKSVEKSKLDLSDYGDIFVIEYKDKVFSVDGHHRLFYLYKNGVTQVNVVCELSDNEHKLYQILADESLELGLKSISDLENKFIDDYEEYKRLWIDKCQKILKEECN
ncbi:hypothetical protein BK010_10565 (plasmid) [Tenericutes bacterium MO-XQ]|nr:hypothetical protein BK010_10565 [Tenericutes bacterium MO-XQ]